MVGKLRWCVIFQTALQVTHSVQCCVQSGERRKSPLQSHMHINFKHLLRLLIAFSIAEQQFGAILSVRTTDHHLHTKI